MIVTWNRGDAGSHMPQEILVALSRSVRRHPWWRARARLTAALLFRLGLRPGDRVLDAGCGWGVTLEHLERTGYRVDGLDVARDALEALDRRRPTRTLIEADLTRDLPVDPQPANYDAVLALDVLEHLDDDRAAVARLGQLARPGGVVVVSVPALPELFGEFDAVQGHRRRYVPETFQTAFDGNGLELLSLFWWGGWMVPLLRRRARRATARPGEPASVVYQRYLRLPPWPAPRILNFAYSLEQRRALDGRLRTGTSLFAVARRPTAAPTSNPRTLAGK